MSKANDNGIPGEKYSSLWFFIAFAVVVLLPFVLPFPISFVLSLIVILCLFIVRLDIALRKAGRGGIMEWYKSFSSTGFGRGLGTAVNRSLFQPLKYSCINCGNEHNQIACPKCGSKAVRPV
jgi:hypothetical protein